MVMLARSYGLLLSGLAGLGAAMLAAVFLAIVYDVSLRTLGFQPPYWTSALSEYAMLYATLLGAPWLVRLRGHVAVEALNRLVPEIAWRLVQRLVYLLCAAVSLILAYYSWDVMMTAINRGDLDIRSVEIPRWLLYLPFAPAFLLMAIEFFRLLLTGAAYHGDRDFQDGL